MWFIKRNLDSEISVLFKCLLYSYLSPKIIQQLRINKLTFEYLSILLNLSLEVYYSIGEMVGAIAAQSLGE